MAERVAAIVKTPKTKQKCSSSCKKKPSYNSSGSSADRILQLQRTAGNQAVQRLLKSRTLQAKLRISQPNDIYEQEADRVAEQVMRMPDPILQRKCTKFDEDKKKVLQTKKNPEQASLTQGQEVPPIVQDVLRSPSQPLDPATRAFMEPRFGHDFSGVRVHTDSKAAESTRAVNALAYTIGKEIVFGEEKHALGTFEGRKLIAHELTHVVQQSLNVNNFADITDGKAVSQNIPSCLQRDISFELKDSPEQSVPTTLESLSEDEMRVLSWLKKYKHMIVAAEKKYCVDRRAIAGAIAWEALENVKSYSFRAVGPGKVHYKTGFWEEGTTTLEQTEKAGYLQSQTEETRKKTLATPEGSINAIAAIMKADADAISLYDINIYRDPGMLATFYNAWKLEEVREFAKKKIANRKPHEIPGLMPNEMGIWVYNHHIFLEEAVGKPSTSASTCYSGSPLAMRHLTNPLFAGDTILQSVLDGNITFSLSGNRRKGLHIYKVQVALTNLGYSLPIFGADFKFGNEMALALGQFQKDNTMPVTNELDSATMDMLDKKAPFTSLTKYPEYAELLSDGLLDFTIAVGFDEDGGFDIEIMRITQKLIERGFAKKNMDDARKVYAKAGLKIPDTAGGIYLIKPAVLKYKNKNIDILVRLLTYKDPDVRKAFLEAMQKSDVSIYTGHGRYGSGPDFDAKTSGAGNILINPNPTVLDTGTAHMYDELKKQEVKQPLPAMSFDQKYKVWFFDGCNTKHYMQSIRKLAKVSTDKTDVFGWGSEIAINTTAADVLSFIDGLISMQSAQRLIDDLNKINGINKKMPEKGVGGEGLGDNPNTM